MFFLALDLRSLRIGLIDGSFEFGLRLRVWREVADDIVEGAKEGEGLELFMRFGVGLSGGDDGGEGVGVRDGRRGI